MDLDAAINGLVADAKEAAAVIRGSNDALIVSHIDADGISSAAIATRTCERLGMRTRNIFAKKMDDRTIAAINGSRESLVWIVDLGSGYMSHFTRDGIIITDHHVPEAKKKGQMTFDSFFAINHINPHTRGLDGSRDASGSSMTYLVSKMVDGRNVDLAYLAVIGSCGDLQDLDEKKLTGFNTLIVQDAVSNGDVIARMDIRLFGKETRSISQMLQYSTDPELPGLTDDQQACIDLLGRLKIPMWDADRYRTWSDLSEDERSRVIDELSKVVPEDSLMGEVYYLPKFERTDGLGEAKEFATALNSCGRYDDGPTGLRMCFGERDAIAAARDRRLEHKRNIASSISYVRDNGLLKRRRFVMYFEAGDMVQETVVGTVAGMLLRDSDIRMPIFAFADSDDGVKVSGRADQSFIARGLDLSKVMTVAAENVGGFGGGHNVAAGATIPKGKEMEFLDIAEAMVASQVR